MIEDLFESSTSGFLMVAIVSLLLLQLCFSFISREKRKDLPGPEALPLLGNLHQLDLKRLDCHLVQLSQKYGPIFRVYLASKKVVVLAGYTAVKQALVNQAEDFGEREIFPIFHDFNKGNGILFTNGDQWKEMRRFALMTLKDFGMGKRTIEEKIIEECQYLIEAFEQHQGEAFSNAQVISYATSNIISAIMYGRRFDYKDPTFQAMIERDHEVIHLTGSPSIQIYNIFPWLGPFLKTWRYIMKKVEINIESTRRIIGEMKETRNPGTCRCFVDAFLIHKENQEESDVNAHYYHEDNLLHCAMNLFGAGTDTTASTLQWGLLYITKYPHIQDGVQEELCRVVGNRQVRVEDRKNLPYMEAVIHETQRMANIVPMSLPHRTSRDTSFQGYFIKKGTMVIPLLTSVLYDESQWEKPHTFNPAHFLDDEGRFVRRDAFMPFSAGRRMCLGEGLARMELFLFFASLLQHFRFKPAPGVSEDSLDLTPVVGITLNPFTLRTMLNGDWWINHTSEVNAGQGGGQVRDKCEFASTPAFFLVRGWTPQQKMSLQDFLLSLGPSTLMGSVALLLLLCLVSRSFGRATRREPPGPRALPLLGNLLQLDLSRPHQTLYQLSKKYGPVFKVHFGPRKVVVLAGHKTVKEALVGNAEQFGDRDISPIFYDINQGHGILFSNGETWKEMRRFALSTLRDFGMGKRMIEDKIAEECNYLIQKFEDHEGRAFDTSRLANYATSNIISSIVYGSRFDYDDPRFINMVNRVNEVIRLTGSAPIQLYNIFPGLANWIKNRQLLLKQVAMNLRDMTDLIQQLKDTLNPGVCRGFVDCFLLRKQKAVDSGVIDSLYNENNLLYSLSNLFGAGTDTTAATLRWGLLLMAKYPRIQDQVQQELSMVVGNRRVCVEDRKNLPYVDAVIHEIQRLGNIVPMAVPHKTAQDVEFRGYFIEKGTTVFPLLTSVLYDENEWETPHTFNPSHFLDKDGKFIKRDAFMPFSAGRRMCLGEVLAKMEIFLFFTSLLQQFRFTPPPGVGEDELHLTPAVGFTLSPSPHKLCAIPRQ